MNSPRNPTPQELAELKAYLGGDVDLIESYYFAVFDGYISDSPAYVGKLMIAVWGMPEFHNVYIWVDGKIQRAKLDRGYLETC